MCHLSTPKTQPPASAAETQSSAAESQSSAAESQSSAAESQSTSAKSTTAAVYTTQSTSAAAAPSGAAQPAKSATAVSESATPSESAASEAALTESAASEPASAKPSRAESAAESAAPHDVDRIHDNDTDGEHGERSDGSNKCDKRDRLQQLWRGVSFQWDKWNQHPSIQHCTTGATQSASAPAQRRDVLPARWIRSHLAGQRSNKSRVRRSGHHLRRLLPDGVVLQHKILHRIPCAASRSVLHAVTGICHRSVSICRNIHDQHLLYVWGNIQLHRHEHHGCLFMWNKHEHVW